MTAELDYVVEGSTVSYQVGEERETLTFASPEDAATWADWRNECSKTEAQRDEGKLSKMNVSFPLGVRTEGVPLVL